MEVRIRIKDPMLRSYLAGLFVEKDEGYLISMDSITGTVICALAKEVLLPPKNESKKDTVTFYLPQSWCNNSLRNKFIVVTAEAEYKINAILRKEFDMNFFTFCTDMRMRGFKLKDIIPIFMIENKISRFNDDPEMLKKRFYRKELDAFNKIEEYLRQKAYYAHRKSVKKIDIECNVLKY